MSVLNVFNILIQQKGAIKKMLIDNDRPVLYKLPAKWFLCEEK